MSPWMFTVYIDAIIKEVKIGMGRRGVRFLEEEETKDCLASYTQMTWFYMASQRKT